MPERLPDALPPDVLARALSPVLAGRRARAEPLGGGLSNATYAVHVDGLDDRFVLRVYRRDPTVCRTELDVLRLVRATVPVPEVVHASPDGVDALGPFALLRWADGITFHELRRGGDRDAIAEAAHDVGATLAAIGRYPFADGGRLGPGPAVVGTFIEGSDVGPRLVDEWLASPALQSRVDAATRERVHAHMWAWAPQLQRLDTERPARLVHGDYRQQNIVVREERGTWRVSAVLDWEFAHAGSPLMDVANFLRYERADAPLREPWFSRGYVDAGGTLPDDWRPLARAVDLTALIEMLARRDVPEDVVAELSALVEETLRHGSSSRAWRGMTTRR